MDSVYLDYNATTPLDPRVAEEMESFRAPALCGNPSSIHSHGLRAKAALDDARERISSFLSTSPSEFIFTSGGSESNNFAVKGVAFARGNDPDRKRFVTTEVEHSSCARVFDFLELAGFEVIRIRVDSSGLPDMFLLGEAVNENTVLVSCMHVNNETGVIMPVEQIGEIARSRGALFHTDITQSVGKIPLNLGDMPVDLASFSSHKIYGPKGVGALFVRRGLVLEPLIHGGGQERGMRAGTENVAAVAGFGKACEIAAAEFEGDMKRVSLARKELENLVLGGERHRGIPDCRLNGSAQHRVANTSNFGFDGVDGESLVMALDIEGISVSTGSACSEGSVEPSATLLAMGLSPSRALSSLRVSLGRFTSPADIKVFAEKLKASVERIRSV